MLFRIPFLSELASHQKTLLIWFYHPLVHTSPSGSSRDAQQCNAVFGITVIFRQYQILSNIGMKRPYPKCWYKRGRTKKASSERGHGTVHAPSCFSSGCFYSVMTESQNKTCLESLQAAKSRRCFSGAECGFQMTNP